MLQATLAFWTVDSLEVAKTLTYGGVEAGQYPLDIYARWLSICQRTCATLTLHRFSRANFDPIHVSTSS